MKGEGWKVKGGRRRMEGEWRHWRMQGNRCWIIFAPHSLAPQLVILHILPCWVKIRLYNENHLYRLPGIFLFYGPLYSNWCRYLHISSSWVKVRLYSENQLPRFFEFFFEAPQFFSLYLMAPLLFYFSMALKLMLFLHISSRWVKVRLFSENQLHRFFGFFKAP